MATLREGANLAMSAGVFLPRLAMALAIAAQDIENEAPETPDHERRLAWAKRALGGQALSDAQKIIWRVALNPVLAAAGESGVVDSDVQWVVNGLLEYLTSEIVIPEV